MRTKTLLFAATTLLFVGNPVIHAMCEDGFPTLEEAKELTAQKAEERKRAHEKRRKRKSVKIPYKQGLVGPLDPKESQSITELVKNAQKNMNDQEDSASEEEKTEQKVDPNMNDQEDSASEEEKTEQKVDPIVIEQEPGVFSRIVDYLSDSTSTALHIITQLNEGKIKTHVRTAHKVDRGILATIQKAKNVEQENKEPSADEGDGRLNVIDHLTFIIRQNNQHMQNAKSILQGSKKHSLELNEKDVLNPMFRYCEVNNEAQICYLITVATVVKEALALNQEIQKVILDMKHSADLEIPEPEYKF